MPEGEDERIRRGMVPGWGMRAIEYAMLMESLYGAMGWTARGLHHSPNLEEWVHHHLLSRRRA